MTTLLATSFNIKLHKAAAPGRHFKRYVHHTSANITKQMQFNLVNKSPCNTLSKVKRRSYMAAKDIYGWPSYTSMCSSGNLMSGDVIFTLLSVCEWILLMRSLSGRMFTVLENSSSHVSVSNNNQSINQ